MGEDSFSNLNLQGLINLCKFMWVMLIRPRLFCCFKLVLCRVQIVVIESSAWLRSCRQARHAIKPYLLLFIYFDSIIFSFKQLSMKAVDFFLCEVLSILLVNFSALNALVYGWSLCNSDCEIMSLAFKRFSLKIKCM